MANIVSFTTDVAGQTGGLIGGVVPRLVRMVVTDNLSTVTTAGYLTPSLLGGFSLLPTDVIEMWYGYSSATSPGTFAAFTPSFSNGVITLVQNVNPGNVLLPVVSGNLASFNGTTGQIKDSGIAATALSGLVTQVGNLTLASFTLNTAAVTGAFATPVQLVAAPSAGLTLVVDQAVIYTASTGNTAYATGGVAIVQYGNTVHGAGTNALSATIPAAEITAAASQIYALNGNTGNALTGVSNAGLFFSNQTGAFTNGTGTNVVITLQYYTITATT